MAFGTLATVNGVGDFASSLIVGLLWTTFGSPAAFGYSAVLFRGRAWYSASRRSVMSGRSRRDRAAYLTAH